MPGGGHPTRSRCTTSAHDLLRRSLTRYGLGGPIAPFAGITRIDLLGSWIPGLG
ncbi:hypothetical protein ACH4CC_34530 [Streptomyces lydicus]|uniref:hypothetical protein n=1 Tax=Streptomyces lydicus TaxID=47763 RepID=UPI0037AAAED4